MAAYAEGVNCVACHTLKGFKGTRKPDGKLQLGVDAYELAAYLQGPNGFETKFGGDENDRNPHNNASQTVSTAPGRLNLPMAGNPLMKTSGACLGCHDKRKNSKGVPLCQTGNEIASSNSAQSCQSCHMPTSRGVMDHSMGGGHSDKMLMRAVVLELDVKKNGADIAADVSLQNQQPHNVPTGAPFRNLKLKLTAYDAAGQIIWSNYKTHPSMEDAKAYFDYKLLKDGKPVPPPVATAAGPDNRLKPYEKRQLSYTIPAANVALVRAELYYNLLWPALNKQLSFLPDKLREAKRIAFAERRL